MARTCSQYKLKIGEWRGEKQNWSGITRDLYKTGLNNLKLKPVYCNDLTFIIYSKMFLTMPIFLKTYDLNFFDWFFLTRFGSVDHLLT